MNYARAWERLLDSMRTWAEVREVPGGIEVTFSGSSGARRTVEIVMTREDWDELAIVTGHETVRSVKERVLALEEDQPFLVYSPGVELLPSSTRELPPDPLAAFKPEPGGEWVATDAAGNVISRLADWNDEQ